MFDGVYYGALAALGVNAPQIMTPEAPAKVPGAGDAGAYSAPKKDFFRSMDAAEFKKRYSPPTRTPSEHKMVRDGVPYRAEYEPGRIRSVPAVTPPGPPAKESAPADQTVLDRSFRTEPIRCIGEALGTYILLERGDKLCVVDKHAAHERILFDKMRLNEKPLMSQELLLPLTFTTDPEGARIIRQEKELFVRLGFELEGYGEDAFAVRAVPADIDQAAAVPLLEELVEKLREGQSLSAADVWERLAATVACKAAVKAGMQLDERELMALAERVLSGEVTHCPHGRPVMQVLTRAELDKRFGRIQ